MVESLASLCAIALVLTVVDGHPTTTSLDIARHFGRRHVDVLRAIENLMPQLGVDHKRNFAFMVSEVAIGSGATRQDPAYRITRDGFTLLAMGFTGKKALQFKLAYIDAFNRMEAEIVGLRNSASPAQLPQQQHALPAPKTTTLQLMLITTVDGQSTVEVLPASELPQLILQKNSPFSEAQALKIALHANMRMMGEVGKIRMDSDIERLRKTVRTLGASDLLEVASDAWMELGQRTALTNDLKEKNHD